MLKLAKLISFVAIANSYSVEYLGIFNYAVSFLLIFSIIGEVGINTYITTEQSKRKSFPSDDILSIGLFKIASVWIMLLLSFCLYLALDKSNYLIFLLTASLVFSDSILTMVYAFYRSVHKFQYEFYFKTIQAIIYAATAFSLYYWYKMEFTVFLLVVVILNICLALYSLYYLSQFKFHILKSFEYAKNNFRNHFKHIFPIFLFTLFTTLYFRIDILMLESMVDIQSVGYYSVAYKLVEGAMVLPLMLGVVFLPKLSNSNTNIKQELVLHFVLGMLIFIIFYFTVASVIKILFADEYLYSIHVAKILSFSIVIMSVNTYMFTYFVARQKSYINVKIAFVMMLANLGLNYSLIPLYGMNAAAYTTVTTELIGMMMLIYHMRKHYARS